MARSSPSRSRAAAAPAPAACAPTWRDTSPAAPSSSSAVPAATAMAGSRRGPCTMPSICGICSVDGRRSERQDRGQAEVVQPRAGGGGGRRGPPGAAVRSKVALDGTPPSSTPGAPASDGPHLSRCQIEGLVLAERRLVGVGVVGDRGAGIAGEELPRGLSGHAERGADLFPGGPSGSSRRYPFSTQPFEFRLTTSQFTQRGEGSGRQRMRDDQVHDTSVTSGPEPASRTTGCRSSSASDSVSGLYDGRCVALRPESARRMPIGSRGIPAPLSAPDASHEVPQNRSRRLHADPVRDSVVVGSRVLIRVAAATVRRECPTRGTGVAHEKADHSIHVAS